MTKELKRVSLVVAAMFLSLFISASAIQALDSRALADDPRNVRNLYESYKTLRGPILVDGKPIATSVESGNAYRYLRVYESEMYSAITGYFSVFRGATGVEAALNSYLSGQSSSQFFEKFNAVLSGNPVSGAAVELTIDPLMQQAAWDALGNLQGSVVVLDPVTGNILAMVSKSSFDANEIAGHENQVVADNYARLEQDVNKPLINKTISGDLYHPGSVFKLVVAAAALESGLYTNDSTFQNTVSIQLPGSTAEVFNSTERACGGTAPTVSLINAMSLSCNVPFVELGLALGQDRLRAQAELFGFGKELRVPMVVTPSIFPAKLDNAQLGLSSIGQYDVRVTPLQMALVSAAVANGGVVMKPNLIESVISPNLSVIDTPKPGVLSQPITAATAESIRLMMVESVENGVASNARLETIEVAGKTGTAENAVGARPTLWFTGFAPSVNPKFVIAVVIEDGGGRDSGSGGNATAAPVARSFFKAVLGK
jgi:peptidoglycan glycosyltransferase